MRSARRSGGSHDAVPQVLHADGAATGPTRIVLAGGRRALVAGGAVASLHPRRGGAVPVVAVWDPDDPTTDGERSRDDVDAVSSVAVGAASSADARTASPVNGGASATRRARRAQALVRECGVAAVAVGRTVRVALPADDRQAVAAIERLESAAAVGPLVVVLAGAWGPDFLAPIERAGIVHADGSAAILDACAATLARHGVDVVPTPTPTGPVARMLLRAGWTGRMQIRSERGPLSGSGPDDGQAMLLILLGLTLALILAGILGAVAAAMSGREDHQRAVDVAALAAAAQMRADWPQRATVPAGISLEGYRSGARRAAASSAAANGVASVQVGFPDTSAGDVGPMTVRVRADSGFRVAGIAIAGSVSATAEVVPPAVEPTAASGDEYTGALASRQGKPMRPDVAVAFDRMNAAATAAGRALIVVSGYRSNAEQARLFAAHPDPKWVARPGTSLHRLGTELDLGPASAYGWLAANSRRFGFTKRYSWEPWHFGFTANPGSAHVAVQGRNPRAPQTTGTIPPWVPTQYREPIRAASVRFKVSAALLSAQLKQESGFDPGAISLAGARGIAQFMPGTAAAVGLRDPFDPAQAIPAQARLMAQLLRRFGSVPLALAAYNAGEGRVVTCMCIPPYPETRHYVATILALMRGYDPDGDLVDALTIRLVA